MTDIERYRDLFVEEAREHATALAQGIAGLGRAVDRATVDALFRAAHSVKGSAATVGLMEIAQLAHAIEDHLDRVRSTGAVTEKALERLLEATDALADAVETIAARGTPVGLDDITVRLRSGLAPKAPAPTSAPPPVPVPETDILRAYAEADPATRLLLRLTLSPECIAPRARLLVAERIASGVGRQMGADPPKEAWPGLLPKAVHTVDVLLETARDPEEVRARMAAIPDIDGCLIVAARNMGAPIVRRRSLGPGGAAPDHGLNVGPTATIRVRTEDIDRLVGLMGEVRIAQTRLDRSLREVVPEAMPYPLVESLHQLELGIRGLYEDLLDMRTVSVAILLDRLPRFVRGLARELGKEVDLVLEGRDTTLDRMVVEVLGDPLMHLAKNALDHGIESPAERRALGKPERGTLRISIQRSPAGVQVLFEDDGRGIDPETVRRKAVSMGLLPPERVARLTPDETLLLLATPGFSTAQSVSEVSGRGVGLDVVKTGIERVGGSIRLASEVGAGTRIRITLPPSLAVIEALEVEVDGDTWFLPVDSVATSLVLRDVDIGTGLLSPPSLDGPEAVARSGLLLWAREEGEDRPIPIVPLPDLLGHGDRPRYAPSPGTVRARREREQAERTADGPHGAQGVVIERHGTRLALVVDRIGAIREVVVKRLAVPGQETPLVSGATITSDGDVALILDAAAALARFRAIGSGGATAPVVT